MTLCRTVCLAFVAGLSALPAAAQWSCAEDRVTVVGDFGQAAFSVEVADEPAERSEGLMYREELGTLEAMLFVYERPQRASFWMRNTLIPLDMIFADERGVVTRIHEEAVPLDETPIDGGEGVRFVLEINGGLAARLGIEEGNSLQSPLIGPEAAVPCN